ncbi:MAG: E3 ubiquitin-protein ligase bre1 [Bathelium mastoideum]|nr:MAG: E3 ubiquitin-protein ligase bre1 [Bathelium mastoideum]
MTLAEAGPLPSAPGPTLAKVVMDERKRPSVSDPDEAAPPAKKHAVAVNGGRNQSDADLPWRDEIDRYQKDAILRQMKEFKREKALLEAQVADLTKRALYHDDHLRIVDTWFSQLLDEIKVLANDIDTLGQLDNTEKFSFHSSLLFEGNEKFQDHLSSRSEKIKAAMTLLFEKLPAASPETRDLQNRLSKLLATEKAHVTELQRISIDNNQLSERLEHASYRYLVAEKKFDRAKSVAVQKLERQAIQGGRSDTGSGISSDGPPAIKHEATNGVMEDGDSMLEATMARKEALATSQKRLEQIQQLESENQRLTEELTSFQVHMVSLSDEDFAKTDLFKLAKSQQEDLIKRINDLEATNVQLREEVQKFQADRSSFRERLEEDSRTQIADSEVQLARAEMDLARIRNSRDELLADQTMRKATESQQRTAEAHTRSLAESRQDRIVALETEIERLKLQLGEGHDLADQEAALDGMLLDDLKKKVASQQKEYTFLNSELQSMEAAFRKASALSSKKVLDVTNSEELVARLTAEKAKADQKYFAAMKLKETREAENRTLRHQNGKSSEIIATLKDNAGSREQLADKLEKQLAEMKEALTSLTTQHRASQQKSSEQAFVCDDLKNQINELKKHITTKDSAAHAASQGHRRTEVELEALKSRLEDTQKNLEGWKKKGMGNQSDEELMLRSIALCAVCHKNFKNTALKTCGHVFCEECVNDRLTSRMRKCPVCGKAFGSNDSMHVTL